MIKFKYIPDKDRPYDLTEIEFTIESNGVCFPELLEQFNYFCLAMGYSPQTVQPEEEKEEE